MAKKVTEQEFERRINNITEQIGSMPSVRYGEEVEGSFGCYQINSRILPISERFSLLEKYLGIRLGESETTGYQKVKKAKKDKK